MPSKWLLIASLPLLIAMECPTGAPGPMVGSPIDNDNTVSGGDQVILTLRITGPVDGDFARVYGIKNDGPQTHADLENRVPQSDFNLTLGQSVGTGMIERTYAFTKGETIALVAVEADGFLTRTPPSDPITSRPMQFDRWEGDYATADIGPSPATLYFTIESDRTIEAVFTPMRAIFINADGGGPHCNVLIDVDVDRYIIPPRAVEDSGVPVNSAANELVLWGYHRDGAILTLQIKDYTDNAPAACMMGPPSECWVFITWNGDCLGSGKTCTLEFGEASDAKVILQNQN